MKFQKNIKYHQKYCYKGFFQKKKNLFRVFTGRPLIFEHNNGGTKDFVLMYFKNVADFCDNGAVLQALLSLNIGRVSPSCSGKRQILSSIKNKKKQ